VADCTVQPLLAVRVSRPELIERHSRVGSAGATQWPTDVVEHVSEKPDSFEVIKIFDLDHVSAGGCGCPDVEQRCRE
jgi:hypothetical protein